MLLEFLHKMAVLMPLVFIPPSFFKINLTNVVELFSEAPSQRIISHSFSFCEMGHLGLNMNLITRIPPTNASEVQLCCCTSNPFFLPATFLPASVIQIQFILL